MSGLEVILGNLHLKNPVMPASGTFAEQMTNYIDINQIGAIIPKSITKNRRTGNSTPRICETKAGGMINSIGIQSEGLTYFKEKTIPFMQLFRLLLSLVCQQTASRNLWRLAQSSVLWTRWMPLN